MSEATKTKDATPSTLFGFCGTEAKSNLGPAGKGSEWHARCPGAVMTGRGLTRCSCPAHDTDRKCYVCSTEVEESEEYDSVARRHTNFEACQIALDLRTAQNREQTDRLLAEVKEDAMVRKQAARATRAARNGGGGEARPRRESRPKPQPQKCHDGCGGMTKGGKFLPGHDAKLKGLLKTADGNPEPRLAEQIARGWLPTSDNPAWQQENPSMLPSIQAAEKLIEKAGGPEQYIAERVAARYEQ